MSFSAGGANVGGVAAREAGNIAIKTTTQSVTADGTYNVDITVPAGKIYILKGFQGFKSSGTYTVGVSEIRIMPTGTGGLACSIYTGSGSLGREMANNFTLPAGAVIRNVVTISGYSVTGDYIIRALIQEVDA